VVEQSPSTVLVQPVRAATGEVSKKRKHKQERTRPAFVVILTLSLQHPSHFTLNAVDLQVSGTILGTSKNPAADPCTSCLAGKYQETPGLPDCDDCQEGKYSETVGSTISSNCLDCQVGRYSEQTGNDSPTDYLLCGQGKFLPTEGEQTSD